MARIRSFFNRLAGDRAPAHSGGSEPAQRIIPAAVGAPLTGHTGPVFSVVFSPDRHRIASASADQTLGLWNPDTGHPIAEPLTGHTDAVTGVAFSPEGKRIVSGSVDGTLRRWPTYPDAVSVMCAKLTANMSHKQWRDWVSPDIDYITVCPDLPVAPD